MRGKNKVSAYLPSTKNQRVREKNPKNQKKRNSEISETLTITREISQEFS